VSEELPKGWIEISLHEVANKITDGTHKTPTYVSDGIRFISIKNIKPYKPINWSSYEKYITKEEHGELIKRCHPEKGDILFPRIGTLGYSKRIDFDETVSLFVGLGLIKPDRNVISDRFLEHYMNSPRIRELSFEKATGAGRLTLALKESKLLPCLVPPLNEQTRIANKLDGLLAKVNTAQIRLEKIPALLKGFRQSVLAAATSGKLTREWIGDKQTKWELLSIADLADVKGGKRLPKGEKLIEENTGLPYIRAGQLKQGTVINTENTRSRQLYLTPEIQEKISRYTVSKGDIYLTIVGASIGDAGVIPEHYDGANLTENAAKLTGFKKPLSAEFFGYWLRSQELQDLIKMEIKSGAQGKLALKRIKELPVPYPNIKEQNEIVHRVKSLFSLADSVEKQYTEAKKRTDRLTQSLLAKAFRGELVPQDPNDEPASELLKRIQAEREIQLASKPKRKAAKSKVS